MRIKKPDTFLLLFAALLLLFSVALTVRIITQPTPHFQYVPDQCACDDSTEKMS